MRAAAVSPGEILFDYSARDAGGGRRKGRISARDSTDAVQRLRAEGLFPIEVSAAASAVHAGAGPRRAKGRLTRRQRVDLIARLAKLTGSRITPDRALSILGEGGDGALPAAAAALRLHMREGGSLLDGLRIHAGLDDAATLALIRGAEVSGELPEALATAAGILEQRLMLVRRIVTGLLYPALLLAVAAISVGLIMVAIIPQFRPLVEDRMDAVPLLGRVVFAVSGALAALWPFLVTLLAAGAAGAWLLHRRGRAAPLAAAAAARLPFVSDVIRRNQITVVLHILGALLRREVVLSEALRVVAETAPDTALRQALTALSGRVDAGEPLSTSFAQANLLPASAVEMLRIGEETGDLAGMAARAADEMREAADRSLERFLALFQPALIIGVGLVVGVSLYALFSAITAVNSIAF